jgi:hypothetical protein
MRHLLSVLLAVVLAPLVWVLTAVGLDRTATTRPTAGELSVEVLAGPGLLVLAGVAYAVLVVPRLSPLGPFLAGLAFLGAVAWPLVDRGSFDDLTSRRLLGIDLALALPADGVAALLAVPLLATVVSPRRWRRHERRVTAPTEAAAAPPAPAAPPYPPPPAPPETGPPETGPGAGVDPELEQATVRLSPGSLGVVPPGATASETDIEQTQVLRPQVAPAPSSPAPPPPAPPPPAPPPPAPPPPVPARPAAPRPTAPPPPPAGPSAPAPPAPPPTAPAPTAAPPAAPDRDDDERTRPLPTVPPPTPPVDDDEVTRPLRAVGSPAGDEATRPPQPPAPPRPPTDPQTPAR